MLVFYLLLCLGTLGALVGGGRAYARRMRRRGLMQAPIPEAWRAILVRNLPPYRHLPPDLRDQLHGYLNIFLDEKRFEGCGGLELTDEIRVTIAAQACLLLIGRSGRCYPTLRSVLVYPHTYVAGGRRSLGGDEEPASARLGESWQGGAVVLSWNSVKGGAANFGDGQNVTLHEFAHQLDQADGAADGTPVLGSAARYRSWVRLFSSEYTDFLARVAAHRKTVIDRYGATNPAEFFATASEAFFEKPAQLSRQHPELYEELKGFYRVDPLLWLEP